MVQRSAVPALALGLLILARALLALGVSAPAAAIPVDGGWPRSYITGSGAQLVLYEPQVASWTDQKRIVMYAAASYGGKHQQTPTLGTLRIEADTTVSVAERLVNFSEFTITASNFPTLSPDALRMMVGEVNSSVPREERVIGLDRVLGAVDASEVNPRNVDGVKADPPLVFYSTTPAVLVNVDGEPIWSPIKDSDLRFALNASWDLFEHMPSGTYFLRVDTAWLRAVSIDGPWKPAGRLPDSFSRLPHDENWKEARAALAAHLTEPPRRVFVSRKPAELIMLRGAPVYAAVPGTGLLWVSNTDSDVFRVGRTGPVYDLVSGRWFSAPDFKGPWTFATAGLPEDFERIPPGHPRSRVLVSVPGTTQALEAVVLAQARQSTRVSRTQATAPDVVYRGEPQFQPIEKTTVARAVNTERDILKVGYLYYMCFDGAWFVSKDASGPWTLSNSIPKEIQEIPISSPAYHVTSVTVESADDEAVVFARDAAYSGTMVAWGCAVRGTGWYYPPYVGWSGDSPVYYPRTGTYLRSAAARARRGAHVDPSWGSTALQHSDQRAQISRFRNRAAVTTRGTAGGGNLFAGHDGNVYRRQGGSWQRYDNGVWNTVERATGTGGQLRAVPGQERDSGGLSPSTRDQLNRDFAARRDGNQRTLVGRG